MTAIQRWFSSLAATAVAVVIAYLWLDRVIALFAQGRLVQHDTYAQLTHIPDPFMPLAIVIFVSVGLLALSGRPLAKIPATALLCSVSVIVAEATKNQLKFVFGRTWPDTWIQNNPSFIHDGVYGFNPFHGGPGYMSFPSGHLSQTCAVISVLWIIYPKWRALYALVVLAVVVGLVGANYHFLSDIIAGAFVGISTGWMVTALRQAHQSIGVTRTD
jgi:membrane-associated phospholipid phosphatase